MRMGIRNRCTYRLVKKIVRGDFVDMAELLRENMEEEESWRGRGAILDSQ